MAAAAFVKRTLQLNDGRLLPVIGLGTTKNVWVPKHRQSESTSTYTQVISGLRAGYRHVDTARMYNNEADVGRAIRDSGVPRSDIFVTTKVSLDDAGYEGTLRAGRDSNAFIGCGYIDLLLLHAPWKGRLESYQALEQLQREGVTRSIGVSNFNVRHLEELLRVSKVIPAVNQIELNPFLQRREVVHFCRQANIVLEAYSPLTKAERLKDPRLVMIARRVNATPAQVCLRWGLEKGFVVLPKSSSGLRQAENIALDNVTLTPDDMAAIDDLDENFVTGWDPLAWE